MYHRSLITPAALCSLHRMSQPALFLCVILHSSNHCLTVSCHVLLAALSHTTHYTLHTTHTRALRGSVKRDKLQHPPIQAIFPKRRYFAVAHPLCLPPLSLSTRSARRHPTLVSHAPLITCPHLHQHLERSHRHRSHHPRASRGSR